MKVVHGHTRKNWQSRTYKSWAMMLQRCRNTRYPRYANHGGRGISVCKRWLKFSNFLADMGERPVGKSIDRKDNDKNYELDNCRWATPIEQSNNVRRNQVITKDGVTLTANEWARKLGISIHTIHGRIRRGFVGDAILFNGKLPARKIG